MSLVGNGIEAVIASLLPSPPQQIHVKPVSMSFILGLFTLALFVTAKASKDVTATWKTLPALETFSSYEDMQRYFDHRNHRRLRHLDNPLDDTYIEAFNQHNEQESLKTKRSATSENYTQQELSIKPALIKFEVSDAVERSEEVKDLIRQYKSRELQQNEKYLETVPPVLNKKSKTSNKHSARPKRSTKYQQPANFRVQYIPFDESDAREPDVHTKILIKRMRALEIEKQTKQLPLSYPSKVEIENTADATVTPTTTTKKPALKRTKYTKQRKPKRTRREAPAAVDMIKFEITDAKDPDHSLKAFMKTKQSRDSKNLKLDATKSVADEKSSDQVSDTSKTDQSGQGSKRFFVFKDAPVKVKKSVAAIPHDVQNIISHIIKGGGGSHGGGGYGGGGHGGGGYGGGGGHGGGGYGGGGYGGGKAYVKFLPAQQIDYNNLKVAYPLAKGGGVGGYGHGGDVVYGKYAHAVPVKFVYQPVVVGAVGGHEGGGGGGGHGGGGYGGGGGHGGGGGGHGGGGYGSGGGHGGEGAAVPIKYLAIAGGGYGGGEGEGAEGGYGGGNEGAGYGGGEGGGEAGGEGAVEAGGYAAGEGGGGGYAAGEGGHGDGGGGGDGYEPAVAIKYVAPVVAVEGGGYGEEAGAGAGAEEGGAEEGGAAHGGYAVVAAEGGYGGGGGEVEHGGAGGEYAVVHGAGYANYGAEGGGHGGGGGHGAGYVIAPAVAAIVHPIVVAEGGGSGGGGLGKGLPYVEQAGGEKNTGNEVIKAVPAPQFKGEVKYSVVPTVEQYAKTATQDFKLKLYSPESLIAKAQLEAQDKAKAIAEAAQKAVYNLAGTKAAANYGGGKNIGGYGGKAGGGGGGGGYGFKAGGGGGGKAGGVGGRYGGKAGGSGGGSKGAGGGGEQGYGGLERGYAGGKSAGGYAYAFAQEAGKAGGGFGGKLGAGVGPVIKIEYHAPVENFKANFKELPEFKQLSSLVGKSPDDQIHGLTYLLAKDMQNRLHLQRQQNYGGGGGGGKGLGGYAGEGGGGGETRPQDNKAPVLFHPEIANLGGGGGGGEGGGEGGRAEVGGIKALGGGVGGGYYQPIVGKYIGMGKSKQYIPVIEQAALEEFKGAGGGGGGGGGKGGGGGAGVGGKNAYIAYGLSGNYKALTGYKGGALGAGVKGLGGVGGEAGLNDNGYEAAAAKLQSYAAKYAFGYRIRDFSTGNDFGHKQNRDMHGVTRGQYHILLPDGRIQNVIYHADDTGFHADVSFESGR